MRKISQPIKLANRPGYYLRWTENGRRKYKQVNTLAEAEMFSARKYQELNLDVYDSVDAPWHEVRKLYLQHYDIDGLAAASKYEAARCLDAFAEQFGEIHPKQITQRMVDGFFLALSQKTKSPHTMNKYKGRLKAFIRWMGERGYYSRRISIRMSKVPQAYHAALSVEQVRTLLRACPTEIWRMRVLLSLVTGLRRADIETLRVGDITVDAPHLISLARKTGKVSVKPLPDALMPVLEPYCGRLHNGRLFPDEHIRITWNRIRQEAGFAKCLGKVQYARQAKDKWEYSGTRQDFRRTHGTLMGLANGLQAAARALEHSSTAVTAQYYSDLALIQRVRVNQLPVKEWLNWEAK